MFHHMLLFLRISGNILHKNTSQCKILILKKAGLTSQIRYTAKKHSTLRGFLPLYSSEN